MTNSPIRRTAKEIDDIRYRLDSLFEVHRKSPVSDRAFEIWLETLQLCQTNTILEAIKACAREQQYAPTPQVIYQLCVKNPRHSDNFTVHDRPADPVIAKAWVIAMNIFYDWAPKDNNPDIVLTRDQALEIVNREAIKYNNPEAIPEKYKINTLWEKADLFQAA